MRTTMTSRTIRRAGLGLAGFGMLAFGLAPAFSAKEKPKAPEKPAAGSDPAAPQMSIEEIMKKGYKGDGSPLKRLLTGRGTKDDAKLMLDLNKALAASKPDKGDQADWTQRTSALLKASEQINAGDRAGIAALKAASDCKSCHKLHKGE